MKSVFVTALIISSNLFAATLNLTPGSTATVKAGEEVQVSCAGATGSKSNCNIVQENACGFGSVKVINVRTGQQVGNTCYARYDNVTAEQNALNHLKAYQDAGLCN